MHSLEDLTAVADDPETLRRYLDENQREVEQQMGIIHKDGVRWHDAPLPPRWHRCWAQTSGLSVARCPCGAMRMLGYRRWYERNSRRKSWQAWSSRRDNPQA